jgi:hypothetical protein
MEHKQEIIITRVGGLGSSDAKMVVGIAERGTLNYTDKERIAIMLGLAERRQITTKAIELGNIIEDAVFEVFKTQFGENITSNPRYTMEIPSITFRVSNHIDFEISTPNELIWVEHKSTIHGINQALESYKHQLAWHAMLGQDKALAEGKKFNLLLSHYDTNEFDGVFDANKLSIVEVAPNTHLINKICKGLLIINEQIPTFEWQPNEGILHVSSLPTEINDKCEMMADHLRKIKEMTEQVDTFKQRMCELMVANNVKSIVTDAFTITLVEQSVSTTFDKSKFAKEHPDMVAQYEKKSIRKAYVNIKL